MSRFKLKIFKILRDFILLRDRHIYLFYYFLNYAFTFALTFIFAYVANNYKVKNKLKSVNLNTAYTAMTPGLS